MKKPILLISIIYMSLCSSCLKDLLEDAPPPPIEDNTPYLRTNTIFGFEALTGGCTVNSCVTNTLDTSLFTYHKSGGLKQVVIGKEGSRIDYTYNTDGRLLFIRIYDDNGNVKKMEVFYNQDKTRMSRVEISTFDKTTGNSLDNVYAEYPANFPKIILYSTAIKEGKKNAVSVCYYDTEGSITSIERGFRDPDTKLVDVRSTETFTYNNSVPNPYYNNVHADFLMLMATLPTVAANDRVENFLGRYATELHTVLDSADKYFLSDQKLNSEGFLQTITYKNELSTASVFEFSYTCE